MAATLIIKNNTASVVTIADVGMLIPASGQDSYADAQQIVELSASNSLRDLLTASTLTVNDGSSDLSLAQALIYLEKLWSRRGQVEAIQIPDLEGVISDVQHGARGGGTQHIVASASINGFMLAADKVKLDNLQPSVVTGGHFVDRTTLYGTSSNTYVAFLSYTFTSAASTSEIQILYGAGQQNSNGSATNYYGLYIDTVFHRSCGVRVSAASQPQPAVLQHQVAVSPSTSVTVEDRKSVV